MLKLNDKYVQLSNAVLAVNYWGELLTVELLAGLLRREMGYDFRDIISRQLMDETRHANVTRALLLERGRDPIRDDGVIEFTYHKLFGEWSQRPYEEVLTFLGSNEKSSSRNFSSLVKVGTAAGDEQLVTVYSEILNDEVNHSHNIFLALPDTPEIQNLSQQAAAAMKAAFSKRYAKLVLAYPDAFGLKPKVTSAAQVRSEN